MKSNPVRFSCINQSIVKMLKHVGVQKEIDSTVIHVSKQAYIGCNAVEYSEEWSIMAGLPNSIFLTTTAEGSGKGSRVG